MNTSAESLGIDLGDQITIEVSGVQVTAEVVNIRRLRTSFQPNFCTNATGCAGTGSQDSIGTIETYPSKKSRLFKICLFNNSPLFPSLMWNGRGENPRGCESDDMGITSHGDSLDYCRPDYPAHHLCESRRQRQEINLQKILGAFQTLRT